MMRGTGSLATLVAGCLLLGACAGGTRVAPAPVTSPVAAARPASPMADEPLSLTVPAPPAESPAQGAATDVLAPARLAARHAAAQVGAPYVYGGADPRGFDCSGLVNHVYREALGIVLPRTSRQLASVGTPVAESDLRPGDLVFFNTRGAANSHVGIYLGDGRFVHAPRARTLVRIDRLDDPGYVKIFEGARRLDPISLVMSPADPRL